MSHNKGSEASVLGSVIWAFGERIAAQLVTTLVSIILARLLDPSEYAVVAIVTVFVTLANVFVTSGFGSALVQKLNADNIDFSTTLYFSVTLSLVLYAIMFFLAPAFSAFYNIPLLVPVVRVMSLRLIFAAVNSVQQAYVARKMEFKKFFYATLIGTVISAVVGVAMAFGGFGVWALVAQYLTNVIVDTVVLAFTCGWRPQLVFSLHRLRPLVSYGWKIIASDLINKICEQSRSLILSKAASPTELSFYNQGERFPAIFINNIETSLQKVLAPVISKAQNDKERVLLLTRKSIRAAIFLIWPLLCGMLAVAEPMIIMLYGEKWLGCVPYVQIVCLIYMIYPVGEAHVRTIKALGKSDIFMKSMVISQVVGMLLLVFSVLLKTDAKCIVATWAGSMGTLLLVNSYRNRQLVQYRFIDQLKDLSPTGVSCGIMVAAVMACSATGLYGAMLLLLQIPVGVVTYLLVSILINRETVNYMYRIMCEKVLGNLKGRKHG